MTDSSDKETVLAANQAFYHAFSNRDLKSMRLLWWQGATSLCIHPGGRVLTGWESIETSWESIFKNTDSLEIDISQQNISNYIPLDIEALTFSGDIISNYFSH